MKIIKVCCSEWINASRDKRELSVCKELGLDVCVVTKSAQNIFESSIIDGFVVKKLKTRYLKARFLSPLNRLITTLKWASFIRKEKPSIISGHNIEGLFIGYLSNFFRKKKSKLIYDSHEYEIGRERNTNKRIRIHFVKKIEKFLIKKSSFSIFVSDSIKNNIKKMYRNVDNLITIRSVPEYWPIDYDKISLVRKQYIDFFGKEGFICMYHGALYPHRGIEKMLLAVSTIPDTYAVILGAGEKNYRNQLLERCSELDITKRVLFLDPVPIEELFPYVGAADLGFSIIEQTTLSYYYCLPNKFFENIQSLTPIIASRFPEMEAIINRYKIGVLVNPSDDKEIISSVLETKNRNHISGFKENLKIAKEQLCWENEKEILISEYKRIME